VEFFQITLVDDDVALTAANIRPTSSSIHVLPKPSSRSEPVVPKTMSEEEMQQFMIAFGMAVITLQYFIMGKE